MTHPSHLAHETFIWVSLNCHKPGEMLDISQVSPMLLQLSRVVKLAPLIFLQTSFLHSHPYSSDLFQPVRWSRLNHCLNVKRLWLAGIGRVQLQHLVAMQIFPAALWRKWWKWSFSQVKHLKCYLQHKNPSSEAQLWFHHFLTLQSRFRGHVTESSIKHQVWHSWRHSGVAGRGKCYWATSRKTKISAESWKIMQPNPKLSLDF